MTRHARLIVSDPRDDSYCYVARKVNATLWHIFHGLRVVGTATKVHGGWSCSLTAAPTWRWLPTSNTPSLSSTTPERSRPMSDDLDAAWLAFRSALLAAGDDTLIAEAIDRLRRMASPSPLTTTSVWPASPPTSSRSPTATPQETAMPIDTEAQSLTYATSVMTINHVVTTPGAGIIGFVVELPAASGDYSCGVALNEIGGDAYLHSGKGGWVPPQPGDDRVTYQNGAQCPVLQGGGEAARTPSGGHLSMFDGEAFEGVADQGCDGPVFGSGDPFEGLPKFGFKSDCTCNGSHSGYTSGREGNIRSEVQAVPRTGSSRDDDRVVPHDPSDLEPGVGPQANRLSDLPLFSVERRAVQGTDRPAGGMRLGEGSPSPSRPASLGPVGSGIPELVGNPGHFGPPKHKRRGSAMSFTLPGQAVKVERVGRKWARVHIPKLGWVRFRLDGRWADIKDSVRNCTVSFKAGWWHVSVRDYHTAQAADPSGWVRGGDRRRAYELGDLVEGTRRERRLKRPPTLDAGQARRLLGLERRKARQQKGLNRYRRTCEAIAKLKARQARKRLDWTHKTSDRIASEFETVWAEDLKIRNMTRSAKGTVEQPGRNVRAKAGSQPVRSWTSSGANCTGSSGTRPQRSGSGTRGCC